MPQQPGDEVATPAAAQRSPVKAKRTEIEGLRAVAALLVAIYHIWLGKVSGGVDVFFTVTGFLITTTLLGQVARNGTVSPRAYLGRLARRVWPLAGFVLLFCLGATATLVPGALRERGYSEILSSALYVENWYLADNAIDYLNAEDPPTLVQHYWAMSIQGQFYVIWLVVVLLAVFVARRLRISVRPTVAVLIGLIGVASLVFSVVLTARTQQQAYFVTPTRLWEFSLGGLVALAGSRILLRGRWAAIASWVGVLGLLACGQVLPVESTFPGWVALWPVGCAMLMLVSTREDERRWSATRGLSWPPMVRLGAVGFGVYLWHWPLLVLYQLRSGEAGSPGLLPGLAIIVTAIALAFASNRLLERPITTGWAKGRRALVTVVLVPVWVGVVAGCVVAQDHQQAVVRAAADDAREQQKDLKGCFGYAALDRSETCAPDLAGARVVPSLSFLLDDTGGAYSCYTLEKDEHINTCRFGHGPEKVAIVGNSHAAMLVPSLKTRVDRLGWQIDTFTTNGCTWGARPPGNAYDKPQCTTRVAETNEKLLGGDPYDLAIFTGGRGVGPTKADPETLARAMADLASRGTRVVVIEDNPRVGEDGNRCILAASAEDLREGDCTHDEKDVLAVPDAYAAAAREAGQVVVPTTDLYCRDGRCPSEIGSVILYRDAHHLTATYVRTIIDEVLRRMDRELAATP